MIPDIKDIRFVRFESKGGSEIVVAVDDIAYFINDKTGIEIRFKSHDKNITVTERTYQNLVWLTQAPTATDERVLCKTCKAYYLHPANAEAGYGECRKCFISNPGCLPKDWMPVEEFDPNI